MEQRTEHNFYRRWGKRTLDVIVAVCALVVGSPLLFLCALAIRLTSRGPALFRQTRVGRFGQTFKVFKFRTMYSGAERLGSAVTVPGDSRVTPVGRVLRQTKLDELPQLLNILRGEMSVVGPRPRIPEEVSLEEPEMQALLTVRPGLTSYASIHHRMEADFCAQYENPRATHRNQILPQKNYLDMEYCKHLDFALDLKLIFLTFFLVFIPGKTQPRTVKFLGLNIRPYSRLGQTAIDLAVFVAAVWLAYWFRFENEIEPFNDWQMAAFVVLIPASRLICNRLFGIYNMVWRYVNLVDAAALLASLSTVSVVLLLLRLVLPYENTLARIFMLPLGVIALEYLLAVGGSLGLRVLRRTLYEMNQRYQPLPAEGRRRILIVGAGLSGLTVALEIGRYPHLDLVGFVDRDPAKQGRLIAGYEVLGQPEALDEIVRCHRVSDVIICVPMISEDDLLDLLERCQILGVRTRVIPTLDQILGKEAEKGLRVSSEA